MESISSQSQSRSERTCPRCGAAIAASAAEGWCTRCLLESASVATDGPETVRAGVEVPSLEEVVAAFPHLSDVEPIGVGGMGAVYKARQPKLDRRVALKVLPASKGADPAFAERFLREARVLARLTHPNIVAVHDFGQSGPFCYLLMEYVDGVNLRQAMRAGRFSPVQALALVPQICTALQFAHDNGVMHRDIKPENILLDGRGRVKLADFGIAKLLVGTSREPALTMTGVMVGTPQYMAPEQVERPADVDHRADIYSLGVVFYELLTGELPLGRFGAPSSKTPLDARVDDIVMRALAKERELRQQSADEVRTAVEAMGEPRVAAGGGTAVEAKEAEPVGVPTDPMPVAPLWQQSRDYRVWVLVLLWGYVAVHLVQMMPTLRLVAGALSIDPIRNAYSGNAYSAGGLIGWVVGLAAVLKVVVGAPVWLRPLRVPTEPGGGAGGVDRALWWGVVAALGVFGLDCLVAIVLGSAATGQMLGEAISRPARIVTRTLSALFSCVYPLLLVVAWRRGVREAGRRLPWANGPLPEWGLGLAMALLVLATGSSLLGAWQRWMDGPDQGVTIISGWWAMVPAALAWWTRSRFWRSVALVLSGCCVAIGLASLVMMSVWLAVGSGPMNPDVTPVATPGSLLGMVVAATGMTVIQFLAWYGLRRPETRRAFGYGDGAAVGPRRGSSVPAVGGATVASGRATGV